MLYISAEDIQKIVTMRDAIESNREAFMLQSLGHVALPVRTNFNICEGNLSSFMPAYITSYPQVGIKIVSTYASNTVHGMPTVNATVILLDPETGIVNAVIDGTELTRMRTGAVSGLATELLATEDALIGAIFGTGGQAPLQLEAMLVARRLSEIRIFDTNPLRVENFIIHSTPLANRFNARLIASHSPAAAVDGADVITTVTTSANPVFNGNDVKQGAHINAVGVFMPHKRELDEVIVTRADLIFVDNWEACTSEAGDLVIPMTKGIMTKDDIAGELGEILLGRKQGRSSKEQITLMKTVGFGTLDIVLAHHVLEKAIERGVGTFIK